MAEDEKDDMEVLFPEREIHGYKIKPWTFGESVAIMPELLAVVSLAKKQGINLENLEERWDEVIRIALPVIPVIVQKTLKVPMPEIDAWPPDKGIDIVMAIVDANKGYLKNFSGLKVPGLASPVAG